MSDQDNNDPEHDEHDDAPDVSGIYRSDPGDPTTKFVFGGLELEIVCKESNVNVVVDGRQVPVYESPLYLVNGAIVQREVFKDIIDAGRAVLGAAVDIERISNLQGNRDFMDKLAENILLLLATKMPPGPTGPTEH